MFQIENTSLGSEKYVPLEIRGKMSFVRFIEEGKLSLYQTFNHHGYDLSLVTSYVLKKKSGDAVIVGFGLGWRTVFLKYVGYDSWFVHKIENLKVEYKDIPEVVHRYNLLHKK